MDLNNKILDFKFERSTGNGSTTYLTHNFHTYPAKFIPQIPRATINALTQEGDIILDPFCGCGTTLVESKLSNRHSIGVDLNPIAALVSQTKTTKLNQKQLKIINNLVYNIKKEIESYYSDNALSKKYKLPDFNNRDHWFQNNVLYELCIIKSLIDTISDNELKNYLYTAFSAIIVTVSNQESDTRFAAINKQIKPFRTFCEFSNKLDDMNKRIIEFSKIASDTTARVYTADSQNLNFIKDNSVDHIVTSPPYANTYDYYLYHKFRMYWLGYDVKSVQDSEIGSRDRHSSKREDIDTFENSLLLCLKEMSRVLKKDKYAVIVIGDSVIRGQLIRANYLLKEVASKTSLKLIKETSHSLKQNSRMFNPKFANKEKLEYIMFFKNEK